MPLSRTLRFRRRLIVAGVTVGVILLVTFYLVFRDSSEAIVRSAWVAHSQQVLSTISRVRLEPASLQNQVWAYRSSHDPDLPLRFPICLQNLAADMQELRELTADNAAQRVVLAELTPILTKQMASLQQAMQRAAMAPDERPGLSFDWALPTPLTEHVQRLFEILDANERAQLSMRTAAVRDSARRSNLILVAAATFTFGVLVFAGALISRELMIRAELQAGIGEAAELLGVKFEVQRHELGDAVKDLNIQIRKRQLAEAELQSLNSQLEKRVSSRTLQLQEANKELETFSYAVSHDLRAPLRHMDGFSHFLQEKYASSLPQEAQHYLNRIRSATTHMASLVEGLLQLSHVGRQLPNLTAVPLAAVFEEARRGLQPEILQRQIDWRVSELPVVEGDSVLLTQVFANLLSNAIKFTRGQPHTVIEVGTCERQGENASFVRDNGVGFDLAHAGKLFGVFQRLHHQDEFEGTGLGLATVQRIIHRLGGRIWAESAVDQGATFYFTLPLSQKAVVPQPSLAGAIA